VSQLQRIFSISNDSHFQEAALELFRFQSKQTPIYSAFVSALGIDERQVKRLGNIPFLPIEFFKSNEVKTGDWSPEAVFTSSGTTGMTTSRHFVRSLETYRQSFNLGFSHFYGEPSSWTFLGLLPSYQERSGSSLVLMVDDLIKHSHSEHSGYFLYNQQDLFDKLHLLKEKGMPTILIGVTYALLDFVEDFKLDFPELVVMETGGMKGRREELTRAEVHQLLSDGLGTPKVHSEYGMTELLSQAYSKGDGHFFCPQWMKVVIRDLSDPFAPAAIGKTGGINIIDLANVDSCAFISTQDLGRINDDGSFEVLGRIDHSDTRGCSLMYV
jgi:Acyl-protein synthetase, LuxE